MVLKTSPFTRSDVEIETEETAFQGFFRMLTFRLRHKLFAGGWSRSISRELFCRGEAAAAVVYDPRRDCIGLVDQFRVGAMGSEYGPWCLEVVAGMIEGDEDPETLILKELSEEAGVTEAELIRITDYYSTPGGCSEKIHLFCAVCALPDEGGLYGLEEEGEDIRFHVVPADEVFEHMYASRVNNAATLIGLQWLQMHRSELRAAHSL